MTHSTLTGNRIIETGYSIISGHRQLDAVRAERLDVAVVHEADAPHIDHPEVGGGLLEGADVEHLVHLTGYSIITPDIVL